MKSSLALCILAALGLAGCATQGDTRVAQADCKVYPLVTTSATGITRKEVSPLEQRQAEGWLGTSNYRRQQLARNPANNNVEEMLRDCP